MDKKQVAFELGKISERFQEIKKEPFNSKSLKNLIEITKKTETLQLELDKLYEDCYQMIKDDPFFKVMFNDIKESMNISRNSYLVLLGSLTYNENKDFIL